MSLLRRIEPNKPKKKPSDTPQDELFVDFADNDLDTFASFDDFDAPDDDRVPESRLQKYFSKIWINRFFNKLRGIRLPFMGRRFLLSIGLAMIVMLILLALRSQLYALVISTGISSANPVLIASGLTFVFSIVFCIYQLRRERRHILDARLERYTSEYGSQLSDLIDPGSPPRSIRDTLRQAIIRARKKTRFAKSLRLQLSQANLAITPGEFRIVCMIFFASFAAISYYFISPGFLITALVMGASGYMMPKVYIGVLAQNRLSQFEKQLPHALEMVSSHFRSGNTIAQALEAVAVSFPDPIGAEFRRVVREIQMGIPPKEAFEHLRERNPGQLLALVVGAIQAHIATGAPLDVLLGKIRLHIRRLQQLKTSQGYLAYFHDLMFPMAVGVVFLPWVIFEDYFLSILQSNNGKVITLIAYTLITLAILISSEAGKQLKCLEKEYQLPSLRNISVSFAILLMRIVGLGLLVYIHSLNIPVMVLLWLWLILLCIEIPYAFMTLFIAGIVVVSQIAWDMSLPAFSIPALFISSSQIMILAAIVVWLISILIYVGLREQRGYDSLQARLAEYGERVPASLEELELSISFNDRVLVPLFTRLGKATVQFTPIFQIESLKQQIKQAGLSGRMGVMSLQIQRLLLTLLFGGGAFYILFFYVEINILAVLIFTIAAAVGGYCIVWLRLTFHIRQHRRAILKSLPDNLLLLELWIEAGLSVDSAMERVYQASDSALGIRFKQILTEVQLGKNHQQAIEDMRESLEIAEFAYLSAGLMHFQQLGAGLTTFLAELREQLYRDQETMIQNRASRYLFWQDFSWRFLLWPGMAVLLMLPLLINS